MSSCFNQLEYPDSRYPDEYNFATYDTNDNKIVEGGFLVNKLTDGNYTLQLYLKRQDGAGMGNLRTTSVVAQTIITELFLNAFTSGTPYAALPPRAPLF